MQFAPAVEEQQVERARDEQELQRRADDEARPDHDEARPRQIVTARTGTFRGTQNELEK